MSIPNRLAEARFIESLVAHGDPLLAFTEAGYEGDPKSGSKKLLKSDYVQAQLSKIASHIVDETKHLAVQTTHDKFLTREGLSEWLVTVVKGEVCETYVSKEGEEFERPARMADRLAAAKLLATIQGMLAPIEIKNTNHSEVFVFHTIDNGRGGIPPIDVKVIDSGD